MFWALSEMRFHARAAAVHVPFDDVFLGKNRDTQGVCVCVARVQRLENRNSACVECHTSIASQPLHQRAQKERMQRNK
jgi:hypothetical protein